MQSEGKKILIVEDEPGEAQALAIALNRWGFSIKTANSGEEGLQQIIKNRFDFIFCDINMPKMDGFEFVRKAKSFTTAKFVFMTAAPTFFMKNELSDFTLLIKPFELNNVLDVINRKRKEKVKEAFC